ncbi:DUF1523 family protein [Phaeovulum sp.]|uniref:DUF1523 family protein n=1 Tax=Phaeovulum sp. TaxID=2934796 RepID=UPI0039E65FBF
MWGYVKWTFRVVVVLLLVAFFHYTLPQHDVVRITRTFNQLTTIGSNRLFYASPDSGTVASGVDEKRDIRFIDSVRPNGKVVVYRNEDTGWIWPPYFKYDSANLQAQASNMTSTEASPKWVMVTHYGWRMPIFSIYPNAVAIKPVSGPDATVFPWVNVIILIALLLIALMIRRMWLQFRERTIDPALQDAREAWDDVETRTDAASDRARGTWGRFKRWLGSFGSRSRF